MPDIRGAEAEVPVKYSVHPPLMVVVKTCVAAELELWLKVTAILAEQSSS